MKYLKILGLSVLAAMALTALAAGTSSATVFCKTATTPCSAKYPKGTKIHAILQSGTELVKTSDDTKQVIDTCNTSTFELETTNEGSSTESVGASLLSWNLFNCSWPNALEILGTTEFHYDAKTGTTTVTGKSTRITEKWKSLIHCHYSFGTGTTLGTLTQPASGSSDTVFHMNMTLNRLAGSNVACAASTVWQATYTVTSPVPLYVTSS